MNTELFSLQFFADDGAGASTGATGTEQTSVAQTTEVTTNTPTNAQSKMSFDDILKDADYKKAYDQRVNSAVMGRLKKSKAERDAMNPMFELLGKKYGLDVSDPSNIDISKLSAAVEADDALWEEEAENRGMTIDGLRQVKNAERQLAMTRKQEEENRRQAEWNSIVTESENLKQIYPNFNLETEMGNPQFGKLLASLQQSGFQNAVRSAYEQVHRDEIMGAGMQFAVQKTAQQMSNAIQSNTSRPQENGARSASSQTKTDPRKLTSQQLKEVRERVMRGEKLTFS